MRRPGRLRCLVAAFAALLPTARGFGPGPSLCGGLCTDHMVLQRNEPARVWGSDAEPRAEVTVSLHDGPGAQGWRTVVGSDGRWSVDLDPQPTGLGLNLTIALGDEKTTLRDIAFGDVVLCSGQSNMEFEVESVKDADLPDADNFPHMRFFVVTPNTTPRPQESVLWSDPDDGPQWEVVSSSTIGSFAAVCYYALREVSKNLGPEVPIGMVEAAVGGTRIEAWATADALESCPLNRTSDCPGSPTSYWALNSCSGLWNGMVQPLLPMRLKFVLWYQGESNYADEPNYACRFPSKIRDWRAKLNHAGGDLPYFFVELAPYPHQIGLLRQAQHSGLLLDGVRSVSAIDQGDEKGDLHCPRKREIGRRLSLEIGDVVYGQRWAEYGVTGPVVRKVRFALYADKERTVRRLRTPIRLQTTILFDNAMGLHTHGTAGCEEAFWVDPDRRCCRQSPFEIGTVDGEWHQSEPNLLILGDKVTFDTKLPAGAVPVDVRYAFDGFPQCVVFNGAGGPDDAGGLPAAPFRRSLVVGACPSQTRRCPGVPIGVGVTAQQCCLPRSAELYDNAEACVVGAGCQDSSSVPTVESMADGIVDESSPLPRLRARRGA